MSDNWGLFGLVVSMFLIGLGAGAFKAIMAAFIADQYIDRCPVVKILKNGEKVIASGALTVQYIYNLYYWVGNLGSLSWFATVVLEKYVSFTAAYILATGALLIAKLSLFAARKGLCAMRGQYFTASYKHPSLRLKNKFKMHRAPPNYQMEHHGKTVPWSDELVDELTRGLMACRVLIGFIAFYICFDQLQNNLISQAGQMESGTVPNDIMPAFNQVACIILGPLIQNCLYPFLRKRNIRFRPIARISISFIFTGLAMAYCAGIQHLIYSTGPCYEHASDCVGPNFQPTTNYVSVWIQLPVYFLIATGEIFAYATALEYAYNHAPKDMKSIVQAIALLVAGLGSACAMALTPAAKDPFLVYLYAALAGIMVVTTVLFWWIFRRYDDLYLDDGDGDCAAVTHEDLEERGRDAEKQAAARPMQFSGGQTEHHFQADGPDDGKANSRPESDVILPENPNQYVVKADDETGKFPVDVPTALLPDSSRTTSFKTARSTIGTASSYETAVSGRGEEDFSQPRPFPEATTLRPCSDATLAGEGDVRLSQLKNGDF